MTGHSKVYTLGQVDYDIRAETPQAVFSTADLAMAQVPDVTWSSDPRFPGEWWSKDGTSGPSWVVCEYEVDADVERTP